MHLKKIKQKTTNLSKIIKIIESQKNITLINILKLSRQISALFQRAHNSKEMIQFLLSKYNVKNTLLASDSFSGATLKTIFKKQKSITHKTLWVYITEEEKYETNSYAKHETNILHEVQPGDFFISVGKRANSFCEAQNFQVLEKFSENNVEQLSVALPTIITNFLNNNGFHNVRFVINSSKLKQAYLDVLPLKELNFNLDVRGENLKDLVDLRKLKIYPNIDEFIASELNSYLTYISLTLLSESALIYQKYQLVAQNQKINELEDKQKHLRLQLLRTKREHEVEQISILSKKKDLLHTAKEQHE
ncbi:MSC_0622 family F1-like ATPase gamma subunit [Mycoplasma corogypsi]|uniref:MSC_0622 family F1-like ATPase gamma subunit n=1 Tax=Mycoplasma corogypsi TaxID=2106 RepID=UPI0038736681